MTSVDFNFNFLCGRPHGLDPLPRPHASTWAWSPPCGCHKWMAPYRDINSKKMDISKFRDMPSDGGVTKSAISYKVF